MTVFGIKPYTVLAFNNVSPKFGSSIFLGSGSVVIGDIELADDVNIWFNTVLRGDVQSIRVGQGTNIQDNTTVHVTSGTGPTSIGAHVTIGHNCVIHACTVGDFSLVGMGSTVLDGAVLEREVFLAAGSVVTPGKVMPSGWMCMGSPAKPVRQLSERERDFLKQSALDYVKTARAYKSSNLLDH
jgi:carbonic anhydrase/acetyltransferase-like protein (isoleucine patch superfamily)